MVVFIAGREIEDPGDGHVLYVRAHARAAAAAGFPPHLFSVVSPREQVTTDVGPLHRTGSRWPWIWQISVPLHAPHLARAVEDFLAAHPGPHVIHAFGLWGYVAVKAARRLARRGIAAAAVTSVYDTVAGQAWAKFRGVIAAHGRGERVRRSLELAWTLLALGTYERQMYWQSRVVLVNYRSVARLYEARYGPNPNLRLIPYTTEMALRPPGPGSDPPSSGTAELAGLGPSGAPLIVAVSRHDPRKGVDVLLQALHRLRKRGIPYRACLVGLGSLLEVHRELARRLGLQDQVAIVGWVPDPEPYLRQADVFVLPSLGEGSGSLSLLEALRVGLPVVASACDGIPEDVTDGESALLVKPGSVDELAGGLERLLGDEPLRRRLGRGAEAVFAARFSPPAFVKALRATYTGLGAVVMAGVDRTGPSALRSGRQTD